MSKRPLEQNDNIEYRFWVELLKESLDTKRYHLLLSPDEKAKELQEWSIVVAYTTSLSAGVDTLDIYLIILVGVPYTMVDFIEQSGRAGRDGRFTRDLCIPLVLSISPLKALKSGHYKRHGHTSSKSNYNQ